MLHALIFRDGEIYTPEPLGRGSIVMVDGKIAALGDLPVAQIERALASVNIEVEVVDTRGCLLIPG